MKKKIKEDFSDVEVVILCGGQGTRMQALTDAPTDCQHRRFTISMARCVDCGVKLDDKCVIEALKEEGRIEQRKNQSLCLFKG